MSQTTQDSKKYFRAGFALPIARKAIFEERLDALGLKTAGELISMFTSVPDIVEVLKPTAEKYLAMQESKRTSSPRRLAMLDELRSMTAEELEALLDARKAGAVASQ